jgi:hypothetical protein
MKKILVLILAAIFGALSCWRVFEPDIFWQIRCGREILETWRIQTTESWSHTAAGVTWYNYEWLSTIFVDLASRALGGVEKLAYLRAFLVAGLMTGALALAGLSLAKRARDFLVLSLCAVWFYLMCSFRFQMRPDLFGTLHFEALLLLWLSGETDKRKKLFGALILVSWTNFHAGTAPLGIIFYALAVLRSPGERKAAWILAGGAAWFMSPLGYHVVESLLQNLAGDETTLGTPDFQPFSLSLFQFQEGGFVFWLWSVYTVFCVTSYVLLYQRDRERLPRFLRDWKLAALLGGLFTFLVFRRIRVIHYQSLILLPVFAAGAAAIAERRRFGWAFPAGALAILGAWMLPTQVLSVAQPLGATLAPNYFPVSCARWLKNAHPSPKMLNDYAFGSYLGELMPDYLVSVDSRGVPFIPFLQQRQKARADDKGYAAWLRAYGINFVIDKFQGPTLTQVNGKDRLMDIDSLYYPRSDWALTCFDGVSVVYLRRIPEHAAIIEKSEYHFIERGLPASFGASMEGLSDTARMGWRLELERCLNEQPENIYCRLGKAAFLEKDGKRDEARFLLLDSERFNPRDANLLAALAESFRAAGDTAKAKSYQRRFEALTHAIQK